MTDIESEKTAIRQTLQYFFDGIDSLNAALILKAFYYKAWSFSLKEKGVVNSPVSYWPKVIDEAKRNPNSYLRQGKSQRNIVYIDITGNAAQVKVEWVFNDFMFTDYYNMLKIDDRWVIVNNTYYKTTLNK